MMPPAGGASTKLYTPALLALAIELASSPLVGTHPKQGSAKSRTCGSEVRFSASLNDAGKIEQIGLAVTACAVGQASAAIFASSAIGNDREDVRATLAALEQWITAGEPAPHIARLNLIEPARAFPGRHEAIMLPWRAALDALS